MKAILEVNFKMSDMFDKESIKNDFGGDELKAMKWLFRMDDLGIFVNKVRLVGLKK